MAYRFLPVSDLPNVDFPTIRSHRQPAGRQPGDDGLVGRDAARTAVLDHRRARLDVLDRARMGSTNITLQFNLTRNLDAAAQDVQAAIAAAQRSCRKECRARRPIRRSIRPTSRSSILALSSTTLPLSKVDEYAETYLGERISMVSGVAQVQVYGAQKYAVRVQLDPSRWRRAASASTRLQQAIQTRNVESADRHALRAASGLHRAGQRASSMNAAAYRAADRGLSQRRAGAARAISGSVLDSVENDKIASWFERRRARIVLAIQRQPGTNTVEVVDNDQASCCPSFRDAAAGVGRISTSSTTARNRSATRSTTCKFTLLLTLVSGRDGDLPVPAQSLGDDHPEPRAADVDHRHVRA